MATTKRQQNTPKENTQKNEPNSLATSLSEELDVLDFLPIFTDEDGGSGVHFQPNSFVLLFLLIAYN